MDHEKTARAAHRSGYSCASSVYKAFSDINKNSSVAPMPRSEGGKCGAVLSAEKVLREMGIQKQEAFEEAFIKEFGSLKCFKLMRSHHSCNDFVGAAARILDTLIQ